MRVEQVPRAFTLVGEIERQRRARTCHGRRVRRGWLVAEQLQRHEERSASAESRPSARAVCAAVSSAPAHRHGRLVLDKSRAARRALFQSHHRRRAERRTGRSARFAPSTERATAIQRVEKPDGVRVERHARRVERHAAPCPRLWAAQPAGLGVAAADEEAPPGGACLALREAVRPTRRCRASRGSRAARRKNAARSAMANVSAIDHRGAHAGS